MTAVVIGVLAVVLFAACVAVPVLVHRATTYGLNGVEMPSDERDYGAGEAFRRAQQAEFPDRSEWGQQ